MVDLEIRELRYFRAVAEELSFSRAAQRLGMAQPPLSRAMQKLERRLGVQLFERSNRGVKLTVAGLTLWDEAGNALAAVAAAAHRTSRTAGETPVLTITAKPGVATDLLRHTVQVYRALPDAATVQVVVSGYGEQAGMLRDGRADIAILGSPFDRQGVDIEPLISEPRVAALPAGHPLARCESLGCRDLAGLSMPQCPGSTASDQAYWSGQDVTLQAEPPKSGPIVHDSSQLLEHVALGQAVALIPASLARHNSRPDIAYRPVHDASPYTTAVAWRSGSRNPWIARLVRTAIELVAGGFGEYSPEPRPSSGVAL
ncbi:LysR family transcriptional regulator [Nonomuraea sp. NPDC049400]|uniref:LysR family transcriptional regulator n=1 Tax=Nonomuraea sp. NPDC049400 TaxID=3364352 RepID=UPI0037AA48DC